MMKVYELNATANDVIFQGTKAKSIEVYAFASDENDKKCTVAYNLMADEQQMFVYDGAINTADPGEGPMEEYKSREEALTSEYGNLFESVFKLADSMK